jgi:hypothetical protein
MSELTWRAADLADAAGLAGLFEVIEGTAPIGLETEAGEVRERLSSPRLDRRTDTLIGVDAAAAPRAYAEAADMGVGAGQFRVRLTWALHPGLGSDSVGSALHRARVQRQRPGLRPAIRADPLTCGSAGSAVRSNDAQNATPADLSTRRADAPRTGGHPRRTRPGPSA